MAAKGIITSCFRSSGPAYGDGILGGGGGGGGGASAGAGPGLLTPDPPTNVTATAGNGEATISFKPPR